MSIYGGGGEREGEPDAEAVDCRLLHDDGRLLPALLLLPRDRTTSPLHIGQVRRRVVSQGVLKQRSLAYVRNKIAGKMLC